MGYIRHNAVIVTSFSRSALDVAREAAIVLDMRPSEIVESGVNGYVSFFIPPDGSKEGWEASNKGDAARDAFRQHCRSADHLDWVEVEYGGDGDGAAVVDFRVL